jgi:hypothetical protein
MPALKKVQAHPDYSAIEEERKKLGSDKACGPIALALLTGCSLSAAIASCKAHGYNPAMGMFTDKLRIAFKERGFKTVPIDIGKIIATYPKGYREGIKNVTTHHPRRFPESFAGRNLLLVVKGHFVAVKDGVVQCYSINNSFRALLVYEILPLEGAK